MEGKIKLRLKILLSGMIIFQALLFFIIEYGVVRGIIKNDLIVIFIKITCFLIIEFSVIALVK
jgi:hypothetical protein